MKIVKKGLGALRAVCLWMAIAATMMLFAVVAINIVGRAIFDATGGGLNLMISGAIELSQYALMISVFAAIPAMLGTGLIRVDVLSQRFPPWLQMATDRIWLLLMGGVAAVLSLAFLEITQTAFARGDETQDLRWPLWPFYAVASAECAALTILAVAEAVGLVTLPQEVDA